jgi:4'-phosphopantetheinyl transferase
MQKVTSVETTAAEATIAATTKNMEFFLASIEFLNDEGIFNKFLKFASKERQEKALAYSHQIGRARSLGAGLLLDEALRRTCKQVPLPAEISFDKHGAPSVKGFDGVYISISHAGNYAAAAVSSLPVGVDIETIRKCRPGICKKCFTPEEAALVLSQKTPEETDAVFSKLWTRKESYIKAIGKGLAQSLSEFSVLDDEIIKNGSHTGFFCKSYLPKADCIVSVCSEKDADFPQEISIVDLQASLEASAS